MNEIELWEQEISEANRYHVFGDLDNKINLLTESVVLDSKYSEYVGVSEGVLDTIKEKFIKAIQTIIKFFKGLKTKVIEFINKIKNRKVKKHEDMFAKEKEAIEKKYAEKIEKLKGEIKDLKKTIDTYKVESDSDKKKYESLQQDMKDYEEQQEEAKNKLKAAIDKLDDKIKKREEETLNKIKDMLKEKDVYIPDAGGIDSAREHIIHSIDYINEAIDKNDMSILDKCYLGYFCTNKDVDYYEQERLTFNHLFSDASKFSGFSHYSSYVDIMDKQEETMIETNNALDKINSHLEKLTKNANRSKDVDHNIYANSVILLRTYKRIITEIIKRNIESYPVIAKAKEMMEIAGMTGGRQNDWDNRSEIDRLKRL